MNTVSDLSNLRGRFADNEATIEGSGQDFRQLVEGLRAQVGATFRLRVPEESASPYSGWLTHIEFRPDDSERVLIELDGDVLMISGYHPALAANLEFDANQPGSGHDHVEYFPDHPFLNEQSVPLVVVWKADADQTGSARIGANK